MMTINRRRELLTTATGFALTLGFCGTLSIGCAPVSSVEAYGRETPAIADQDDVLTVQLRRLHREIAFGNHLAIELFLGTTTLSRATEQVEPHMRARPDFKSVCDGYYRAPSVHHGTARYLIGKVQKRLDDTPLWWMLTTARLEAEYAAMS